MATCDRTLIKVHHTGGCGSKMAKSSATAAFSGRRINRKLEVLVCQKREDATRCHVLILLRALDTIEMCRNHMFLARGCVITNFSGSPPNDR
jgi:hypothetical protein